MHALVLIFFYFLFTKQIISSGNTPVLRKTKVQRSPGGTPARKKRSHRGVVGTFLSMWLFMSTNFYY